MLTHNELCFDLLTKVSPGNYAKIVRTFERESVKNAINNKNIVATYKVNMLFQGVLNLLFLGTFKKVKLQ